VKKSPHRFLLLLVVLFFFACTQPEKTAKNKYGPVSVTSTASFVLLAPEYIEKNLDTLQRISGAYGKNQFAVNAWVKADKTEIVMELLNDMGNSLGTLSYTGGDLHFTSSFFPRNLKAEYAVADFQFCFYQADALRAALGKLILKIEGGPSGTEKRLIYEEDTCIIEIEKNPGLVRYVNHLRGYAYTIQGDFL
jgi:hypothetical protein